MKVEQEIYPGATIRVEFVRCGRNCRRCPHGPFYYAYWREGKRLRKRYLGKDSTKWDGLATNGPPRPRPDQPFIDFAQELLKPEPKGSDVTVPEGVEFPVERIDAEIAAAKNWMRTEASAGREKARKAFWNRRATLERRGHSCGPELASLIAAWKSTCRERGWPEPRI